MYDYIPLNREFIPITESQDELENNEIISLFGRANSKTWDDLDQEFRCVILAEAGAGKTVEFTQHAKELNSEGKPAFFIRIEDIERDFENAFEIGDKNQFQEWLVSTKEAWFLLDSVDEARLNNPKSFRNAIKKFSRLIKQGEHRAHVYISSRPYAWRPREDQKLLDEVLFLPQTKHEGSEEEKKIGPESALTIYQMNPLDKGRIRRFCSVKSVNDVDDLLSEIERANLFSLAERPFDLEGIIVKWKSEGKLGGRLDLLCDNITKRLCDDHNPDRADAQPLNIEQAREGARRLAAAVILTDQVGINVPGADVTKPGIDAEFILNDWNPADVRALLERGLFNDILYDAVRFRHRDIRELLAAEWFDHLLKSGNSRATIEDLFFREQYGEKIITPRLRPILPWLILFDDEIRRRAIAIQPEIVVEGGDPSRLPLPEREKILSDIIQRISTNEEAYSTQFHDSIVRIANNDLEPMTKQLINRYGDNDDAIFFLARLVWQGQMTGCIEPLIGIVLDDTRGIYTRKVSVQAVLACGSSDQKHRLWKEINERDTQIPWKILTDLVGDAKPDNQNIEFLLDSLGKLPPHDQFRITELLYALHGFIEQIPVNGNNSGIMQMIKGMYDYLILPPFVKRQECRVSKKYAWLLDIAIHAVERLVKIRNPMALDNIVLSLLMMVPALRFWDENSSREYKNNLHELIPDWPELNDALYWASIKQVQSINAEKSNEPVIDDFEIHYLEHYWNYDVGSLPRLLDIIRSSDHTSDEKQIVLRTAFRIYMRAKKSRNILSTLKETVDNQPILKQLLAYLLNPPDSEAWQKREAEHAEYERKQEEAEKQRKYKRDTWITEIKANPERIDNHLSQEPNEFTYDHIWLMREIESQNTSTSQYNYENWKVLIPEFSEEVALAYRNAAVKHWRNYVAPLRSEGYKESGIPYSLLFAMAGLNIEVAENSEFVSRWDEDSVRHALRFITWKLNGLPDWLENIYRVYPGLVKDAVVKEMLWELENYNPDKPMYYILYDLAYHAPWLHQSISPMILEWIEANPTCVNPYRYNCMKILVSDMESTRLAKLTKHQISHLKDHDSIAWWYALWVDCDPQNGIPEVKKWLSNLSENDATYSAQLFITNLLGAKSARENILYFGHFHEAKHLKSLYELMHHYIRLEDDNNHVEEGFYSLDLRDNAQSARNQLFSMLADIKGKESYTLIKQLIKENPDLNNNAWMTKRAYEKAEKDGDLESWSIRQVKEFNKSQTFTPETHIQLHDLAVYRLIDLKNWVEQGNDSQWELLMRVEEETEMRNWVAGWLRQASHGQYTVAQEPELANNQRMDIWLNNPNVKSPVPIELKLLDKGWSGNDLCDRLETQLVGGYLREETARCGIFLLVWLGKENEKTWIIDGKQIHLDELCNVLQQYWQSIADKYTGVDAIKVIVIDVSKRGQVCNS